MKIAVLLSGGMDSSVLLAHVVNQGNRAIALSVDYGQRHLREIASARIIAESFGVSHEIIALPASLMAGSVLTGAGSMPHGHYADPSMRKTVVPARNTVLLAVAAAVAVREECQAVAYACHSGDHSIYPDCRPEFVQAFSGVLGVCDYQPIQLVTPFLGLAKSDIVRIGFSLGFEFSLTWSCYEGQELHCGKCGTCFERKEAFAISGLADPTEYIA